MIATAAVRFLEAKPEEAGVDDQAFDKACGVSEFPVEQSTLPSLANIEIRHRVLHFRAAGTTAELYHVASRSS